MQVLDHPIITKEGRNTYIRGFLISTKPSAQTRTNPEEGFSISKETGHDRVKTFLKRSFSIIPEELEGDGDGHFYANTEDELIKGYDNHAHGIIDQLYGPFYYEDGTGDYWYDFGARMFDSAASRTLQEYGERMWTKFAVSPHIVREEENPHNSKNWRGIGVALVKSGAFGLKAVISKLCNGTKLQCAKSMAGACSCCQKTDDKIVQMINSHLSSAGSNLYTMDNPTTTTASGTTGNLTLTSTGTEIPKINVTSPIEEKKEEKIMTLTEYEELKKIKEDKEKNEKILADLQIEYKTNVLSQIFSPENIKDEATRKTLFDKYFTYNNVKEIRELYGDFLNHIVPTLKEQIKAELEKELKAEQKDTGVKGKTSAGSLRPEPVEEKKEVKESAGAKEEVGDLQLIHNSLFGRLV